MAKVSREDVVIGLIVRSTEVATYGGEVCVLGYPNGPVVKVEAFDWQGIPYTREVRVSSLRWQ
jgi:hypothetical protein